MPVNYLTTARIKQLSRCVWCGISISSLCFRAKQWSRRLRQQPIITSAGTYAQREYITHIFDCSTQCSHITSGTHKPPPTVLCVGWWRALVVVIVVRRSAPICAHLVRNPHHIGQLVVLHTHTLKPWPHAQATPSRHQARTKKMHSNSVGYLDRMSSLSGRRRRRRRGLPVGIFEMCT